MTVAVSDPVLQETQSENNLRGPKVVSTDILLCVSQLESALRPSLDCLKNKQKPYPWWMRISAVGHVFPSLGKQSSDCSLVCGGWDVGVLHLGASFPVSPQCFVNVGEI